MKHLIICPICGKEFTQIHPNQITCGVECRRKYKLNYNRERKARLREAQKQIRLDNRDLKIYEILDIMYNYNLTIQEYLDKREFYKELYLMKKEVTENES